ncbi:MAG: CBS domain-containing protein [Proteobacteria bacterium]|nr:CBS domain-containing protein [Pseudomonadota bacterium]
MRIDDILHHKGHAELATVAPADSIAKASRLLDEHNVGALVVTDRLGRLVGILSERDIVRGLARDGAEVLHCQVQELMTKDVLTCRREDKVKDVMATITIRRVRHLPVVEGERLVGIVSIGDVLKSRLEETTQEMAVYRDLSIGRV